MKELAQLIKLIVTIDNALNPKPVAQSIQTHYAWIYNSYYNCYIQIPVQQTITNHYL